MISSINFSLVSTVSICSEFCAEIWLLCCDLGCKWVICRNGFLKQVLETSSSFQDQVRSKLQLKKKTFQNVSFLINWCVSLGILVLFCFYFLFHIIFLFCFFTIPWFVVVAGHFACSDGKIAAGYYQDQIICHRCYKTIAVSTVQV